MLKIIRLFDKLAFDKNNGNILVFGKNNNNKPASRKNNSNNEFDKCGINRNSLKYVKKLGKLSKLGKKLSKSRNSTNFGTMETKPKFLTLDAKTAFNRL